MVGIELLDVGTPDALMAVKHRYEHREPDARRDRIATADDGVGARRAGEQRGRRPQPQRLLEDLEDIGQPVHLLVAGRGAVTEHLVDFGAGALGVLGILDQVVDGEGE